MSLIEAIQAMREIVKMMESMDQNDKLIYEYQVSRIKELCNQVISTN